VLIVAGAFVLARLPQSKLRLHEWLLLGLGLTQVPVAVALLVVSWFFVMGSRAKWKRERRAIFNLGQLALVGATLVFLGSLSGAVYGGLVGAPDMQVEGSGSYNGHLVWYVDRGGPLSTSSFVFSTSLWLYRGLMLGWSLWLAKSVLTWVKWAFELVTSGGFWEPKLIRAPGPAAPLESEDGSSAALETELSPSEGAHDISGES
jgi:hypothetical protein